jgi:type IV pilus assembly protein PilM
LNFQSLFSLELGSLFNKGGSSKTDRSSTKPYRQIGLNIGKANIVGCEVMRRGDEITLERCARVPIKSEEQLSAQIKEFCETIGFQTKQINISMKGQGIVIRFLAFPRMSDKEFQSSIQYEAEKYLPFNLSDIVLDYHIIKKETEDVSEKMMDVILVAAKKTEVEKLMRAIQPSGLSVNAIDLDVFSCLNALEFSVPEMNEKVVGILDLGAQDTTLCISNHGVITFSRDIAFGGNDMTEMLKRALNVSTDDAEAIQRLEQVEDQAQFTALQDILERLFQELKLSLNYFFNQHQSVARVDHFFISGGLSQVPMLADTLEKRLEMPVSLWDPTAHMKLSKTITREALKPLFPFLPVAAGLALRPS